MQNKHTYYSRFIVIILVIMMQLTAVAQQRYNPFEIRQRVGKVKATNTVVQPDSMLGNPVDTLTSINDKPLPGDTVATPTQGLKPDSIKAIVGNPFEVDHLPIRVSNLDKRKEELKTNISSTKSSNGFLFWFLLVGCGLFAIVMNSSGSKISYLPQTLYNENILKLIYREESNKSSIWLTFLYIIFWINMSIFVYLVIGHYGGARGISIFGIISAAVLVTYLVRHTGLAIIGSIFNVSKSTDLYSFTIKLFNAFIGVALIPINFILAYSPDSFKQPVVIIAFIFIGILLVLRIIRGLFIASEYLGSRMFQFFVYLCAVEIAPILISIKFLTQ
jgi:hypothetical protein